MPFTFSHPAVVFPIKKLFSRLSLTGLILGSIAPDFEYFIRMKSKFSHTIDGAFWFDLPMAIIVGFIFFNIIQQQLISNLPKFLRNRLQIVTRLDWNRYFINNWFIICISMLIGVASHLLWDSFTHYKGDFVQQIPLLRQNILLLGYQIPLYRFLQHFSTVLGGLALIFIFLQLPQESSKQCVSISYWLLLTATASISCLIFYKSGAILDLWTAVISLMSSIIVSLIITPIVIYIGKKIMKS